MRRWTLEQAKNQFSELVRRALAGDAQVVIRGGREEESVVIISRVEHERLLGTVDLATFLRESPVAKAVQRGELSWPEGDQDPFERPRDMGRELPLDTGTSRRPPPARHR